MLLVALHSRGAHQSDAANSDDLPALVSRHRCQKGAQAQKHIFGRLLIKYFRKRINVRRFHFSRSGNIENRKTIVAPLLCELDAICGITSYPTKGRYYQKSVLSQFFKKVFSPNFSFFS